MRNKPSAIRRRKAGRINLRAIRIGVLTAVILGVLIGEIAKLGVGNLSSLTLAGFSFLSPFEFLEVTVASQAVLPLDVWLAALAILLATVILGRFFCGWVCPFALLRIIFRVKEPRAEYTPRIDSHSTELDPSSIAHTATAGIHIPVARTSARYAILVGVLALSALLRVPFFLLFWPMGLFFGFLFAVVRLFSTNQPSLELVIFPALLAIELSATSWCRSICPLGTMLSLTSGLNRLFRPVVNRETCLVSRGVNCEVCHNACPEKIDLRNRPNTAMLMNCTK
jgi:ferredoxin-type protein NapH